MKIYSTLVFALAALLMLACSEPKDDSSSQSTKKEIKADADEKFYAVRIGVPADVRIIQGDEAGYTVDGEAEDLENLQVRVRKGALTFNVKRLKQIKNKISINITGKDLEAVQMSGSGMVDIGSGVLKASEAKVVLSGSGTVTAAMERQRELTAILSGSGQMNLKGKGRDLDILLTGSGNVDAADYDAEAVNVNLAGSGDCRISANKTLATTIAGSGSVTYTGDPQVKNRITGSGSVNKED